MAITLSVPPGTVCYTGNMVRYIFDYSSMNVAWKLEVGIVDGDTGSNIVIQQYPFTSSSDIMRINIGPILDAYYKFNQLPNPSGTTADRAPGYLNKFRIQYRVIKPNITAPAYTVEANWHFAIKGGIGMMSSDMNSRVNTDSWYNSGRFLPQVWMQPYLQGHFMNNLWRGVRNLQPDEYCWLLYMNRYNAPVTVVYDVAFLDGTTNTTSTALNNLGYNWDETAWWVPVGINQCNLDPTNKGIHDYSVYMTGGAGSIELCSTYIIPDYRSDYRGLCLYWRNSYGGIDHIKLRGVRQVSISTESKNYDVPADVNNNGEQLNGLNIVYDGKMRVKWKGNTGYVHEDIAIGIMDMMTQKGAWLLIDGYWQAVQVSSTELIAYNTEDKLRNIAIEFQSASFSNFPLKLFSSL